MPVKRSHKIIINSLLSIASFVWVFPILFAVLGSLKSKVEYNTTNFWELPTAIALKENWDTVQQSISLLDGFKSSLIYAFTSTTVAIVIAVLAAYGLSHLHIKFKMFWFLVIYSGTIFPFQTYLIPVFSGLNKLGLYNTKLGMLFFYTAICIPFSMFVFRNYFIGIPSELGESAKIDGATDLKILTSIFIPMAKTPLLIVFLTQFSWVWNDMMFGLTFTKDTEIRPIMAGISLMGKNNIPALLLACMLASIPTIILFVMLNKGLDQGVAYQSK